MKKLVCKTKKKYSIVIEKDDKINFFNKILPFIKGENLAVVTDNNVDKLYGKLIDGITNKKVFKYVIKSGENNKNFENYIDILNKMAKDGFTRQDTLITFGGGVVGDLGGFISATYMRGINLIAIPTTLLAMVDSSVGGKTAINLSVGKNLCGSFYQPSAVYINLSFLKTLNDKEIKNGYGEIVKYYFINRQKNISLESIDEQLVYNCLKIKSNVVKKDERESSIRKLLNFGHTFGHAIEVSSKFTLSHGESVAKGIFYALTISKNYFKYGNKFVEKYKSICLKLGLDYTCKYKIDSLIEQIKLDKKKSQGAIDFVLIDSNKKAKIVKIETEKIKDYLD